MYERVFTTHKPLMNGEPSPTSMSLGTQIISLIIQNFNIFLFDKSRRLCSVTLFYPRHVFIYVNTVISLQILLKCSPCLKFIYPYSVLECLQLKMCLAVLPAPNAKKLIQGLLLKGPVAQDSA